MKSVIFSIFNYLTKKCKILLKKNAKTWTFVALMQMRSESVIVFIEQRIIILITPFKTE